MDSQRFDYSKLFSAIATPIMVLDPEFRFIAMNEAYLDITKRSRDELVGQHLFDVFPERQERRARLEQALKQTLQGETTYLHRIPFAIPLLEGGVREAFWSASHAPAYDDSGKIVAIVQHTQDVTAEIEAERMKEVVTRELQHRVGNLLSLVSTIARRTAESEGTKEEFVQSFTARIQSLSETHKLLTQNHWGGIDLGELIRKQFEIYSSDSQRTLEIDGPPIRLNPNEAQSITMAVHELATNAAKYGALKHINCGLKVSWEEAGGGGFNFHWVEYGLKDIREPARTGFGSIILLRVLPAQLNGTAERSFIETGHEYHLYIPERDQA